MFSSYLNSVPSLQLTALRLVQRLVLIPDLFDRRRELIPEKDGRINALVLELQVFQLLDLLGVDLLQKDQLLLQALLIILEHQATFHLRLQLKRNPLDLAEHAARLLLVALLFVLQVLETSLQQADLRLIGRDLLLQISHALLLFIHDRLNLELQLEFVSVYFTIYS